MKSGFAGGVGECGVLNIAKRENNFLVFKKDVAVGKFDGIGIAGSGDGGMFLNEA